MNVQILVSTMNQTDYSLIDQMNLFADSIVINQCDQTNYTQLNYNGHRIDWYNTETRGVGISRNMAILYSSADICLFADDDMVYDDQSLENILSAFKVYKDADMIVFEVNGKGEKKTVSKRIRLMNAFSYGTFRIAVRRDALIKKRIMFSVLFGGGAKYSCGEDTIFINDFLKNRLRCYFSANVVGTNTQGPSTWFKGYNEKFIYDKGVLMRQIFGVIGIIPLLLLLNKHLEWGDKLGKKKMMKLAVQGWKDFGENRKNGIF